MENRTSQRTTSLSLQVQNKRYTTTSYLSFTQEEYEEKDAVPIEIVVMEEGSQTISLVPEKYLFHNVFLIDRKLGVQIDLLIDTHQVSLEKGVYLDRFYLSLKRKKHRNSKHIESCKVLCIDQRLVVNGVHYNPYFKLELFSLCGELLYSWKEHETLEVASICHGYYILCMELENGESYSKHLAV